MRYVFAIAALVLSGVMLILGIGQRTFLAGPAEISFPVDTQSETGYAILKASEFENVSGQANVVVKGSQAFVASGSSIDVEAWVEPFDHAELSINEDGDRVLSKVVAAVEPEPAVTPQTTPDSETESGEDDEMKPIDPRGSDLWLEERSIDNAGTGTETETLRFPVTINDQQSLIIASNGVAPLPDDVALVWVQDRNTPWAGPLLVGGGVFALVGGVLYLLAVDHDRRGLGPRRGRRGPLLGIRNMFGKPRVRSVSDRSDQAGAGDSTRAPMNASRWALLPALGLTVALGLSGCSASYWPSAAEDQEESSDTETPVSSVAPLPVTDTQIERIVERVSKVAEEGDANLDAAVLEARFTGSALQQRAANYTIRAAKPDYPIVPPRITDETLQYELVQSTVSWPRTIFVTVASAAPDEKSEEPGEGSEAGTEGAEKAEEKTQETTASPSLALMLTQTTPQENFMVTRVMALRGGISMPQAAPVEEGTALLSNDLETLMLPPGEVGTAFASVLQGGTEVEQAKLFDLTSEPLLENYGLAYAKKVQQDLEASGQQSMIFSDTASQGEQRPTALSTGVGGALVATTVIEQRTLDSAGGRYKPEATGLVTALSGLSGQQDRIVQEISHQILFFVPSKSDGGAKIQVLGVSSELVGARN